MSRDARAGRRISALLGAATVAVLVAACGGGTSGDSTATASGSGSAAAGGGEVTLEFAQWWEPELPEGALPRLMDQFEAANPGIKVKLLSAVPTPRPRSRWSPVRPQAPCPTSSAWTARGSATSSSRVSIADLTELMTDASYDESELASQIKIDGATYMIPVVNFVYPLFTNDDLLAKAGVTKPPTNRTEFADAAKKVTAIGGDVKGWIASAVARRRPTASRTTSCPGCGPRAARCSRTASRT